MKKIMNPAWFFLTMLGLAIYSNTFLSPFQCDDFYTIVGNQTIRNLADLSTIWQAFNTRFTVGLSLALNYALGKENVLGYHLFNTLVHILNSFWVYLLVNLTFETPRMKARVGATQWVAPTTAFFTALVFLTHPLQTQAVTYVWQRTTSLATFFYLGALVFYIRGRLKASWRDWGLCLLSTVLGMLTKEIVFTLPFMIFLYEFIFLKELPFKKIHKIFLWGSILFSLLIIPWMMTQTNDVTLDIIRPKAFRVSPHEGSLFQNLLQMTTTENEKTISRKDFVLTQLNVLRTYLRLLVLPLNQNIDYDYPKARSLMEPDTFFSFLLLLGLFGSGIFLLKKNPLLAFGIFWFFLTLSLESLIVTEELIFEHRLYLPMAGFSLFVVSGISLFFKNNPRKFIAFFLALVGCYSFLTYQRNFVWKDELTLWSDVAKKSPKKARAYNGRGSIYEKKGKLDLALADYDKAIEREPNYADAYVNRGSAFAKKGLLDRALADSDRAIKMDPTLAEAYNTRGLVYSDKGLSDEALANLNKAIGLKPDYASAYSNRGAVYEKKGLLDAALADLNKAITLKADFAEAYNNRGYTYERMGLLDLALENYNKAVKLKPDLVGVYSNRASVYLKKGLLDQALSDTDKVISLSPNARAYNNRAAVYSLKKEFDKSRRDSAMAKKLENSQAHP